MVLGIERFLVDDAVDLSFLYDGDRRTFLFLEFVFLNPLAELKS